MTRGGFTSRSSDSLLQRASRHLVVGTPLCSMLTSHSRKRNHLHSTLTLHPICLSLSLICLGYAEYGPHRRDRLECNALNLGCVSCPSRQFPRAVSKSSTDNRGRNQAIGYGQRCSALYTLLFYPNFFSMAPVGPLGQQEATEITTEAIADNLEPLVQLHNLSGC